MPKVIYAMGGVSADGYIVGPDGKFDWSVPDEELHRFHNEQMRALAGQLLGVACTRRWSGRRPTRIQRQATSCASLR